MSYYFLEIDGSTLEGGGQILRMSIAFSAILGKPVRVSRIRANRSKPGLAAQHLKGIQLVAQMCQAKTEGLEIGSTEIQFSPGKIRGGHYLADCVTAGSISLLLQVALPCALLADRQVTLDLKGGTNADMAPQVDYMTEVFRPVLEKFGGSFDFDLHRRGYFPKGGGHVTVTVNPVRSFNSVQLTEQGRVEKVFGWSFVAGTSFNSVQLTEQGRVEKVFGWSFVAGTSFNSVQLTEQGRVEKVFGWSFVAGTSFNSVQLTEQGRVEKVFGWSFVAGTSFNSVQLTEQGRVEKVFGWSFVAGTSFNSVQLTEQGRVEKVFGWSFVAGTSFNSVQLTEQGRVEKVFGWSFVAGTSFNSVQLTEQGRVEKVFGWSFVAGTSFNSVQLTEQGRVEKVFGWSFVAGTSFNSVQLTEQGRVEKVFGWSFVAGTSFNSVQLTEQGRVEKVFGWSFVAGTSFNSVQLTEQGRVEKVFGWSFVAGTLPIKMAHEMSDGAKEELSMLCRDVQIECYKEAAEIAPNNCSGIIVVCTTSTGCILGGDALGARGVAARAAGRGAGAALAADVSCGACLDTRAQDQVIIYMALASGASAVRVGAVTMHTQTAMHVASLFTSVKFNVVPCGDTNIIECTGSGFTVPKPV